MNCSKIIQSAKRIGKIGGNSSISHKDLPFSVTEQGNSVVITMKAGLCQSEMDEYTNIWADSIQAAYPGKDIRLVIQSTQGMVVGYGNTISISRGGAPVTISGTGNEVTNGGVGMLAGMVAGWVAKKLGFQKAKEPPPPTETDEESPTLFIDQFVPDEQPNTGEGSTVIIQGGSGNVVGNGLNVTQVFVGDGATGISVTKVTKRQ